MLYRISHTTAYRYEEMVSTSYNHARLTPRDTRFQQWVDSRIIVDPPPDTSQIQTDYFGNSVNFFSIHQPHRKLTVKALATVRMLDTQNDLPESLPWETVVEDIHRREDDDALASYEFCFDSPMVPLGEQLAAYARPSFTQSRPLLDAVTDLNHRIHRDFNYDPAVTTISTPIEEVLKNRHGVCQDFAHVMIGCLRSLGLAARYVSGYLRPRYDIVGAQASHAWVSAYSPGFGWVDFDPTNDAIPAQGHVTLAWGRDFGDVTPVKGVMLGGGEHILEVGVKFDVQSAEQ